MKKHFSLAAMLVTILLLASCAQKVNGQTANPASDFEIEENEDGTLGIAKYTGSKKEVVIPNEIKGKMITAIEMFAFSESDITSIVIPNGVRRIAGLAFCKGDERTTLTSITIGANVDFIDGTSHDRNWTMYDIADVIAAYNRNSKKAGVYTNPTQTYGKWKYQTQEQQTSAKQTDHVSLESGVWLYRPDRLWIQKNYQGIELYRGYEVIGAWIFRDGVARYYDSTMEAIERKRWRGTYTATENMVIVRYEWEWKTYQITLARQDNTISDGKTTYTWEDVDNLTALLEKYPEITNGKRSIVREQ